MLRKVLCPKPELPPTWDWVRDRIERKDFSNLTQVQAIAIHEEQTRRMEDRFSPAGLRLMRIESYADVISKWLEATPDAPADNIREATRELLRLINNPQAI